MIENHEYAFENFSKDTTRISTERTNQFGALYNFACIENNSINGSEWCPVFKEMEIYKEYLANPKTKYVPLRDRQ